MSFRVSRGFWFALSLLLVLTLLTSACRNSGQTEVNEPTIYLLDHEHWTPLLVLNFTQAIAPEDFAANQAISAKKAPQLQPEIAGEWRWQDPSRLVFYPTEHTLPPDTGLSIALQPLKLRAGVTLEHSKLYFKTPELQVLHQDCRWQADADGNNNRHLQLDLQFNYPLYNPSFSAKLANGTAINISSASGTHIIAQSTSLPRPAEATSIRAQMAEELFLYDLSGSKGAAVELDGEVDCKLVIQPADWDIKAPVVNATASGVEAELSEGKILLRLTGENLSESATKDQAGQILKDGIAINPAIDGEWRYGDQASTGESEEDSETAIEDGADLIFTPKSVESIKPGTRYQIELAASSFANVKFQDSPLKTQLDTPAMSVSMDALQLLSDPTDPKIKRATTTLHFSYPPSRELLNAKTQVWLRGKPNGKYDQAISFEISYDAKDPLLAYVKTQPLTIANQPSAVKVLLDSGVTASFGGTAIKQAKSQELPIPSSRDYFQISDLQLNSVVKPDENIERLLILTSNVPVKDPTNLPQSVSAYLLPNCAPDNPNRPELCAKRDISVWESADQVDAEALKLAQPVTLQWQDSGDDDKTVQHLTFNAPEKQQVLVRVAKGLESIDGFTLAKESRYLLETGANQRELKILHDGALLSLSGDKKLGVTTRGVQTAHVKLQRVVPHNMHHVVHFTSGKFQNPDFNLPLEHFAESFEYDQALPSTADMQRQYFAVDFAKFMRDKGFPPRGLFVLSVSEKKPEKAQDCGESSEEQVEVLDDPEGVNSNDCSDDSGEELSEDRRLVLLTDMGLLVKSALNGKQDVFVMSFRSGQPMADVSVSLLGKNGVPIFSGKTDAQGKVSFASTEGLKGEKQPTVYLAEKDGDLSFIPFHRDNRHLDVSRFDIDGERDSADTLQAFLFSDRGIYRPGDTAHIGLILRKRDWSALPTGLPLKAIINDPEGQEVWSKTLAFGAEGFNELSWTSSAGGKTGTYRVELIIADKTKKSLGSTRIRVEEFEPDRLQVKTDIPALSGKNWLSPAAVKARVSVRNLFGTAAAGNPAKLELSFRPWSGKVAGCADFHFRPTLPDNIPDKPQDLGQTSTNEQGEALFDLPLASVSEPLYEIALAGEGFEKGTGRSVVAMSTALVSSQPFIVGYKADGNLDYISKDTPRKLSMVLLGDDFKPHANETLSVETYEKRYVSSLVKRNDGLYQYQSVLKETLYNSQPLALKTGSGEFSLVTDKPGQFYAVFKNAKGEVQNRVEYTVAGEGNVTRNVERNAELNLTLDKNEYLPGATLNLQVVAPYAGAGLITIEQDGVLVSQWIKTTTTASNHQITLPANISGNAYVSVAFVRSLDSKEIYMSPLSYGVAAFNISKQPYTLNLQVQVPETAEPGKNLEVTYSVDQPSKLVLYAVDEGILQFAHYSNPLPLDYLFRKRALQVETYQILDMILPDYALVHNLSAPGGDEDALMGKYKNPFARKHKAPMAFWSGMIDAQPGQHTASIPIPDYFNGTVRVIALAVNQGRIGTVASKTVASQKYVIQPQQPYVVAPGDEFDMGVLVANNSGIANPQALQVSVKAEQGLELASDKPQNLQLAHGQDGTVRFHAKAKQQLGPINIKYQVTAADGKVVSYGEEMSIRPAQPLLVTRQTGQLSKEDQAKNRSGKLEAKRQMFNEQRQVEFAVSATPASYLRGIVEYLKHYPYGCTEQITSQAFPAVVLGANPELGLSQQDVATLLERSIKTLQSRQKFDGSFGYWSVAGDVIPHYSLYATHMLLEAQERGHKVPEATVKRALEYADQYAQAPQYTPDGNRDRAYALYLLARSGQTVAERLHGLEAEMQSGNTTDLQAGFWLGAAYKLHHLDQDAERLLGSVANEWQKTKQLPKALLNSPEAQNLYLLLVGKHLPELYDRGNGEFGRYLLTLSQDRLQQRVTSIQGSMALLGMSNLWNRFEAKGSDNFTVLAGTPLAQLALQGKTIKSVLLGDKQNPVELRGDGQWNLYYQLSESGYDLQGPDKAIAQQLTINRWLLNDKGEEIKSLSLQDKLHLRIALHPDHAMNDVAVVVLVPGGFEIDLGDQGLAQRQSLPIDKKPLWQPDYIDVQEDRVVLFGKLDGGEKYFEFRLKPLNTGKYQVPGLFAEGMYDNEIQYRGLSDVVEVKE